jgi:hypothetical protein
MAKSVSDTVLDTALNYIKNNGDLVTACNAEPLTLADAVTNFALAQITISGTDFGSPVNGDVSGRKIAFSGKTGDTVDVTDTATHIAIVDSGVELLYVTTCTSQALTISNPLDYGGFDIELEDPA